MDALWQVITGSRLSGKHNEMESLYAIDLCLTSMLKTRSGCKCITRHGVSLIKLLYAMKSFALVITLPLAALGIVLAVLRYMEYTENPKSAFESYEELERSGLIARGWLPQYLPPSATNIKESHNLDTNRVWATFRYQLGDLSSVESACNRIAESDLGKKFLCPPFGTRTSTVVLRNDGEGYYLSYENGI
jgi:hypothetical protein